MFWTDDQLDRLRDKLVLARRAGEWLTAADIGIVLGLLRWWRRATLRSGWSGPSDGLPPTIADMRAQGISHVFVACANPACHSGQRRIALTISPCRPAGSLCPITSPSPTCRTAAGSDACGAVLGR